MLGEAVLVITGSRDKSHSHKSLTTVTHQHTHTHVVIPPPPPIRRRRGEDSVELEVTQLLFPSLQDFVRELLCRIRGMRKLSAPTKKGL